MFIDQTYTLSLLSLIRLFRFSFFCTLFMCLFSMYYTSPPPPAGQLALAEGTYTAEYVEFEVRRALEWIGGNEHKRLAAVSFL